MKTAMKTVLVVLATFLATSSGAQESGGTDTETFPVGTDPEVQAGQTYTAETFDDWDMMCVKAAEGPEPCEIGQLILDQNSTPVADVRVFPLPPGTQAIAGATFVTPLGVMLPNGMVFAVDDKKPKQYPFAFCSNVGCVARVGFTALELESLRSGSNGKITIRMINNPGQPIDIGLSLKGFSAAFAALSKKILEEKQGQ